MGWLLDRIDARKVMVAASHILASGYIVLAHTHTFPQFFICNLMMGVGFVASNRNPLLSGDRELVHRSSRTRDGNHLGWRIDRRRGDDTDRQLRRSPREGWQFGYPRHRSADGRDHDSIADCIRPNPAPIGARTRRLASEPAPAPTAPIELPGLELGEALRTRSMWLITLVQFLFASLFAGLGHISSRTSSTSVTAPTFPRVW